MWGNRNKTLLNKLQKLQKRAARIVTSSAIYDANVGDLFIKLERTKLRTQRQMQKAESFCMVLHWSISKCAIYQPWWHKWIFLERLHQQRCSSISLQHFLFSFINSFSFSGAVHWNSLPLDSRQAESQIDFWHHLPSYILFQCDYMDL